MFRSLAKIEFLGVPHRGGAESITALLGQQVDFVLESPVVLLPLIRDGKVRALGVTSAKRQAPIPDVPTMVEAGVPGFVATLLTGIVAPAGTPAPIVAKLQQEIAAIQETAELKQQFAAEGVDAMRLGSAEFGAFFAQDMGKWERVVKEGGIKPE